MEMILNQKRMNEFPDEEPYKRITAEEIDTQGMFNLVGAIITAEAKDYINALVKVNKVSDKKGLYQYIKFRERFFNSQYLYDISGLDGRCIIKMCKKIAQEQLEEENKSEEEKAIKEKKRSHKRKRLINSGLYLFGTGGPGAKKGVD